MNMFSMGPIDTRQELESLVQNTYFTALIFMAVAFAIAVLIANLIKWQGKPDNSYKKRRVWWVVIGVVVAFVFFIINATYVAGFINKSSLMAKFGTANIIATVAICLVGYFVLSIITMLIFRSTKWGSILGPSKKN